MRSLKLISTLLSDGVALGGKLLLTVWCWTMFWFSSSGTLQRILRDLILIPFRYHY